jgi:hypothetical protein
MTLKTPVKALKYLIILLSITSCAKKPYSVINYFCQTQPETLPEIFAPGVISIKGRFEMGLTIAPNGKSMAFGIAHETNAEETCIYLSNFSKGKWSIPNKKVIADNTNTFFPMFSPNGKELFFAKSINDSDIWVGKYSNNEVIKPHLLDSPIASVAREAGHGLSFNGSFYFTSNRDDKHPCCGDIFRSKMDGKGNYSSPTKVNELSTDADEESLFLSPNEDYIVIQAWRDEFQSKHDLYLSYRSKTGEWTLPHRLDTLINSKSIEQRPFISPDRKYLFFSRTTVSHENKQEAYKSDIYWVSTKHVFKPYAYNVPSKIEVTYNKPFRIQLPRDLFKDVDNHDLLYNVAFTGSSKLPEWINFDYHTLVLTGEWKDKESDSINISATDVNKNESIIKIPVIVKVD